MEASKVGKSRMDLRTRHSQRVKGSRCGTSHGDDAAFRDHNCMLLCSSGVSIERLSTKLLRFFLMRLRTP